MFTTLIISKRIQKLTLDSVALLSRLTNLKHLRIALFTSELVSEALTSLVSLRDLDLRSKELNEQCMNDIADNLTKLTRIICAGSEALQRTFKLLKIQQLYIHIVIVNT